MLGLAAICLALGGLGAGASAAVAPRLRVLPPGATSEAERPQGPDVFGTIALPVRAKPTSTRWARIMLASVDQPALAELIAEARRLSRPEQLAFVQSAVARAVRNSRLSHDCSDDGYWAVASETLARGVGDCFDIAIAKMEALRLLGIPESDMYLTTGYLGSGSGAVSGRGRESWRGRESAALLVRIGDGFWLLTEHARQAVEANGGADSPADFVPVVTYGVGVTWVHGTVVKAALAERLAPGRAIMRQADFPRADAAAPARPGKRDNRRPPASGGPALSFSP